MVIERGSFWDVDGGQRCPSDRELSVRAKRSKDSIKWRQRQKVLLSLRPTIVVDDGVRSLGGRFRCSKRDNSTFVHIEHLVSELRDALRCAHDSATAAFGKDGAPAPGPWRFTGGYSRFDSCR